jgi:hypothetical protein
VMGNLKMQDQITEKPQIAYAATDDDQWDTIQTPEGRTYFWNTQEEYLAEDPANPTRKGARSRIPPRGLAGQGERARKVETQVFGDPSAQRQPTAAEWAQWQAMQAQQGGEYEDDDYEDPASYYPPPPSAEEILAQRDIVKLTDMRKSLVAFLDAPRDLADDTPLLATGFQSVAPTRVRDAVTAPKLAPATVPTKINKMRESLAGILGAGPEIVDDSPLMDSGMTRFQPPVRARDPLKESEKPKQEFAPKGWLLSDVHKAVMQVLDSSESFDDMPLMSSGISYIDTLRFREPPPSF